MYNKSSYDAILPASVRYARNISNNEKIFYLELTSLANMYGYSWATNEWLANMFNVSTRTISTWISKLSKNGYILARNDSNNVRHIYIKEIEKNHRFDTEGNLTTRYDNLPGYYSVLPPEVRYALNLTSSEKLLYSEIRALANQEGYCWAKNEYFIKLYKTTERTVSRQIKNLQDHKFIFVNRNKRGKRLIFLATPKGSKKHIEFKLSTPSSGNKCPGTGNYSLSGTNRNAHKTSDFKGFSGKNSRPNNIDINNINIKDTNRIRDSFVTVCKKTEQTETRRGTNHIGKILGHMNL